jgi:uncharacterized protein (DUF1499 family)
MLARLFFVVVLVLAGLGLAVRVYMARAVENELRPYEKIAIRELRDPIPQNTFLACPAGYCAATAASSPIFAVSVARLADDWGEMVASESGVVPVAAEPTQHRLVFIQHTMLLRFPDIVTVEFVDVAPDRSSLAIYSRSRYGRGDFGTNRRRVERWLSQLAQIAG